MDERETVNLVSARRTRTEGCTSSFLVPLKLTLSEKFQANRILPFSYYLFILLAAIEALIH